MPPHYKVIYDKDFKLYFVYDNWKNKYVKHFKTCSKAYNYIFKEGLSVFKKLKKSRKQKLRDKIDKVKEEIGHAVLDHPYNKRMSDKEADKWAENFDKILERFVRLRIKYHKFMKGIK